MRNINYLLLVISIIWLSSCSKENELIENTQTQILNQSVSGTAHIDENGDGMGDIPMEGARIYLGDFELIKQIKSQKPDTLDTPFNEILWNDVDENGDYMISGIPVMENKSIVIYYSAATKNTKGTDTTPDGDFLETEVFDIISVTVEENEHDDGNNFTAELINGAISGNITIDEDKDGSIDGPLEGAKLWLSRRSESGGPIGLALDNTYTDENGNYIFTEVPEGEYVVSFADVNDYRVTDAGDESPDGDLPTTFVYWIPVDLVDGEHDSDNNFKAVHNWHSVTGTVLEDTSGDGNGDTPLQNHRVEIYLRDASGQPTGSYIGWSPSDVHGNFRFLNLDPGNYVIKLLDVVGYECVSGMDTTPESGEPTSHPDCSLIQADVLTQDAEDEDNIFVRRAL